VNVEEPTPISVMPTRFPPGQLVATPGALEAFGQSGDSPLAFLMRHLSGDWGELDAEDKLGRFLEGISTLGSSIPAAPTYTVSIPLCSRT
jgi:hypothetical protein